MASLRAAVTIVILALAGAGCAGQPDGAGRPVSPPATSAAAATHQAVSHAPTLRRSAPATRTRVAASGPRLEGRPRRGPERKLAGRLHLLADPVVADAGPQRRAKALGLPPSGPGSVVAIGRRIVANVRLRDVRKPTLDAVRDAGAFVHLANERWSAAVVAVLPKDLTALARVPGVISVEPALMPYTNAAGCTGNVVSEADGLMNVASARALYNVTGAGVKVGVISDSFNGNTGAATGMADDIAVGDLPGPGNTCGNTTPPQVLRENPTTSGRPSTDEGRAMAQAVHDLAPGANILFASAWPTELDFINSVQLLRDAGARVIVDDLGWGREPIYQDGQVAIAVNDAAAAGVSYFSSAGNSNSRMSGISADMGSWEALGWRATACPFQILPDNCMDFDPGPGAGYGTPFVVPPGGVLRVTLHWAQSLWNPYTDLNLYLLDSNGNVVAFSVDDNSGGLLGGTGRPFEFAGVPNTSSVNQTYYAVVGTLDSVVSTSMPLKLLYGGAIAALPAQAPDVGGRQIAGHAAAAGAQAVGAVPYDNTSQPEDYSSRGPVTKYFEPAPVNDVTCIFGCSAAALPPDERVIAKPDVAAIDCAATSFFDRFVANTWRFCGTSQAAPHAAAIAALELQLRPWATPQQVRDAQKAGADPVGAFPASAVGAGLVNAGDTLAAISQIPEPAPATVATDPAAAITDTTATLNGRVNPRGTETSYRFELGSATGSYQLIGPVSSAGAGTSEKTVSNAFTGGTANTVYHYRVVALRNGDVVALGQDRSFTTTGGGAQPTGGGGTPSPSPSPAGGSTTTPPKGASDQPQLRNSVMAVTSISLVRKPRAGRMQLRIRCRALSGSGRCRGVARLDRAFGKASFDVAPGVATVTVTLSRKARSQLARRGVLRTKVTVQVRQGDGSIDTSSAALVLRR